MSRFGVFAKSASPQRGLVLLFLIGLGLGCHCGRSGGAKDESLTISPCPMPRLDVKSWVRVEQKRFTFSLPSDFRKKVVHGGDSWVGEFQSTDSSVVLSFDWGGYSNPLTKPTYGVTACVEKIGERRSRLVVFSLPNPYCGDGEGGAKYGAGAAWRDVKPGVHLTMFGWARERRGLDQLLRIFRTVRFEESG